ncbi:MAG: BBP7 family outer membrane beta-barrel protein [Planctomycetota bacterium]|nr:BBP7 family outer membrane beta-barrel protein [Planctomycetota bacterium]
MKTNFKRLTLAALLLAGTSASASADDKAVVSDLPGFGEEAYFHADGAYVSDTASLETGSRQGDFPQAISPKAISPETSGATSDVIDQFGLGNLVSNALGLDRPGTSGIALNGPLLLASTTLAGDLAGSVSEQYVGDQPDQYVGDQPIRSINPIPLVTYQPIGATELQPATFLRQIAGADCDSPDGACDDGCDSASGKRHGHKLLSLFDPCDSSTWASGEALLWFAQSRDMMPLVTLGPAGSDPTFSDDLILPAGASVAFGDSIDGGLSAGFRGDYGRWISSNVGLGGRFWIMSENEDSFAAGGAGTGTSIARTFLNLASAGEDSVIINNDGTGTLSQFGGDVSASSSLNLWAAEAYTRLKFSCDKQHRVEFLGGFSHFEIDDDLAIASTSIENASSRVTTFSDRFEAENRFNGGQLGFEMVINRGKWTARSLTKVHLGNMNQKYTIAGTTSDTLSGATSNFDVGMLARENSGTFEKDVFAFIPEANFKLAYELRKNMQFSVGYSFLYFDNVALNGSVMDRVITDGAALQTGVVGARPAFVHNDSSLWVQGIDLGLSVNY